MGRLLTAVTMLYTSLVLHELGHCIFGALAGLTGQWEIEFGKGQVLFEGHVGTTTVRLKRIVLPVGRARIMRKQGSILQGLIFTAGGPLTNGLIALACSAFLYTIPTYDPWGVRVITGNFAHYFLIVAAKSLSIVWSTNLIGSITYFLSYTSNSGLFIVHALAVINSVMFIGNILPIPWYRGGSVLPINDGGWIVLRIWRVAKGRMAVGPQIGKRKQ